MKILYGVQGTGNGHVTRARIMAKAFAAKGVDVDWVFSGRHKEDFFDMEDFGNYRVFRGLTFAVKSGRILYLKTALQANVLQLMNDSKTINVEGYDLIINDFEPVTAWAAKRAGKKVIGISHQNSFFYDIPKKNNNIFTDWFMKNFAPVTHPVGIHWHHFNQPIIPPLIEASHYPNNAVPKFYLVYLPFGELNDIVDVLKKFPDYEFYIYVKVDQPTDNGNIHVRPFSREGFQKDLHRCEGVICSAGFELPSEAIQLGKKLLVQPVAGQMEQASNALALSQLGLGSATRTLNETTIGRWLPLMKPQPIIYPNVASSLVDWILKTGGENFEELQKNLWSDLAIGEINAAMAVAN